MRELVVDHLRISFPILMMRLIIYLWIQSILLIAREMSPAINGQGLIVSISETAATFFNKTNASNSFTLLKRRPHQQWDSLFKRECRTSMRNHCLFLREVESKQMIISQQRPAFLINPSTTLEDMIQKPNPQNNNIEHWTKVNQSTFSIRHSCLIDRSMVFTSFDRRSKYRKSRR